MRRHLDFFHLTAQRKLCTLFPFVIFFVLYRVCEFVCVFFGVRQRKRQGKFAMLLTAFFSWSIATPAQDI